MAACFANEFRITFILLQLGRQKHFAGRDNSELDVGFQIYRFSGMNSAPLPV
jgi:hypothetical protein